MCCGEDDGGVVCLRSQQQSEGEICKEYSKGSVSFSAACGPLVLSKPVQRRMPVN